MLRLTVYLIVAFLSISFSQLLNALPLQSREMQKLWVENDSYGISVDNDPAWTWHFQESLNDKYLSIETPDLYYPPSVVNIRSVNDITMPRSYYQFKRLSKSALIEAAKNFNFYNSRELDFIEVTYKNMTGWMVEFIGELGGTRRDIKIFILRNADGRIFSVGVYALPETISHVQPAIDRILNSFSFIQSNNSSKD